MIDKSKQKLFIEACYRLYERKLYAAAYSVLRDEGQAEDAVQDTFLNLIKGEVFFEDAASDDCKRYVLTCLKNAAITRYRKLAKEWEREVNTDEETLAVFAESGAGGTAAGPESAVDNPDSRASEIISLLPEKYREVMRLMAVEELPSKEAAKRLNMSEAAVRKRYERAKKMLREKMNGGAL